MADQTEELDNPIGVGISELDVPQDSQPAHPGGQGDADDIVTEEDTTEPGQHDEPLLTDRVYAPEGVAEEDSNEPAQDNEPLEVLSDRVYTQEGTDEPPPESAFSSSSSDVDDDSDDEEPEQGDDEFGNAANLESQSTNYGLWQPHQEPFRPVLGIKGSDEDIYRPNCRSPWRVSKLHPDRESGFSNSNQRMKTNEEFRAVRENEPHRLVRPSPLRTTSSLDSPVSPKNKDPTGDVGILPEPSPGIQYDKDPVSPLSDLELRPRPQNPSPPESPHDEELVSPLPLTDRELNLRLRNSTPPKPSKYTSDFAWDEEPEDKDWITEYIAKSPGSPPADGGDEALSDEQRSPVSPIDPVSEPETRVVLYRSNPPNETFDDTEASEADVQMPQQTSTAPETFESVYVGAEEHYDSEKENSPTSPDFLGPEPLTGKTPEEGIEAWWAFRESFRAARRTLRTNRNPANQDEMGDLQPTTATNDAAKVTAKLYLAAQRLDVQQLVNLQQTNLQAMARQSDELSKVIESDLRSALEYVKLRMLKYRFERNKFYEERDQAYREASRQLERVGRRDKELNAKNQELRQAEQEANQYITNLNTKLWETERAYKQVLAEKKEWEPTLRKEREKRERLRAEYKAQAEMSAAYLKAAEASGKDIRLLRAKFAKMVAPLQFSLIMEVASQAPEPAANEDVKQCKQVAPLQVSSVTEAASQAPVSGSSEKPKQPKQPKQAAPLQFSSIMEIVSQAPVLVPSEKPHSDTNDVPQSETNDKPKSDKSEKRKPGVSQRPKHGRRITDQQFASFMEVFSKSVSDTNTNPERTKQAKRAAPGHLSPFMTYKEFDSQGYESDAGQHPKSAPPTYSSRRGPPPPISPHSPSRLSPPRLAPEHEANWPLAVRPPVVDFMTEWINNNRETRQLNDASNPLQKAQLDKILGVGFLSWDRLIKELFNLGYSIRRDRLAQALSEPEIISAYNLPKPNTAVLYEARRLTKHNAVKELVDEVAKLERELEDVKMPWEFVEELEELKLQNKLFKQENRDLNAKLDEVYQGLDGIAELEKAWKEIDRLRDVLTDCAANPDYEHSPADQEEIRTLKEDLATTQETLAEVLQTSPPPKQKTLTEVKSDSMYPASLPPSETPGLTELLNKLTGMDDANKNSCKDRNVKLSLENGTLTQKLDAMRSDADDRAQELSRSHASYASLVKTSSEEIASLKAKLAAGDSSRTGDAKPSSSVEDKLAAYHEHGMRLESDINDLRRKLGDSREQVADLETKLAAHDNDQDGDVAGDQAQIEALKEKALELEQELAASKSRLERRKSGLKEQLAACRSRGEKLQERIEELEVQLETQGLQRQGNAGTSSDLSDRPEAIEQHAKDLQEKVDELQLQMEEAKKKKTPKSSEAYKEKVLASIAETKAHRNSLEIKAIAKSDEVIAGLQKALEVAEKKILALQEQDKSQEKPLPTDEDADKTSDKYEAERLAEWNGRLLEDAKVAWEKVNVLEEEAEVAEKEILALKEQARSHEKPLPTDEPAPVSPGPAVAAPDQSEDVATLRRELAEAREKNEKLGLDNFFLQTSLGQAQEGLSTLRKQVKSESPEEPEPAGERRSDLYSQGFENDDDAPLEGERTRSLSADGSATSLEKFVLEQSDSEAEETSGKHSETGNAGSSSGPSSDEFVPEIWTEGPPSRPDGHIRDSPFRRPGEDYDEDDDESDAEDFDRDADENDLAEANASLRRDAEVSRAKINKLEKELEIAKANRPIAAMKAKKPLPAVIEPAQPQQLPKAVESEPETETRTTTRILAPRRPQEARKGVPLLEERPRTTRPRMSMAQAARRTAMYQSPTYIAEAARRREIREEHFAERRERIRLICQRAASIFGEEDLPYVPVEQRYKPMARRRNV